MCNQKSAYPKAPKELAKNSPTLGTKQKIQYLLELLY